MLDWVLFIVLFVSPGTIEVRATSYATAEDCKTARAQALRDGMLAACERRPNV